MGKTWRREQRAEMREVSIGEAMGVTDMEPQTGLQQFTASLAVVSADSVQAALKAAYSSKAFLTALTAKPVDVDFAAMLGIALRKDSKGRQLALQSDDLPAGVDFRLEVMVPDKGGNPVVRRLGATVRHNRALSLAVAAGRLITAELRRVPKVADQAKLLGMELAHLGATAEERKAAFSAFFGPHTVRVELSDASAFLTALEPVKVSRRVELRKELKGDGLSRVDALLAQLKAGRGSK